MVTEYVVTIRQLQLIVWLAAQVPGNLCRPRLHVTIWRNCASQTLISGIVSFLFYLRNWIIRRPWAFVPVRHTRPAFQVNRWTFQLRNLVVAFYLESGAVGETGRGGVIPLCLIRAVTVGNLTARPAYLTARPTYLFPGLNIDWSTNFCLRNTCCWATVLRGLHELHCGCLHQ